MRTATTALPYENATAGARALDEIQRLLERFGCSSFGTMVDNDRRERILQFRWRGRDACIPASWDGYAQAWIERNPWSRRSRLTREQHAARATEIAKIAVCSILRDMVKSNVTTIECGIMPFEDAFFAHMIAPTGERVIDAVRKNTKLLPAPREE